MSKIAKENYTKIFSGENRENASGGYGMMTRKRKMMEDAENAGN